MAKESNNFYEAERKNIVLSQSDFAHSEDFESEKEISILEDYLLTRQDWLAVVKIKKSGKRGTVDTIHANKIFSTCHEVYKDSMDSVTMFDIITNFYSFDVVEYYKQLGHSLREILIHDLTARVGKKTMQRDTTVDDKRQPTFLELIKKFK